jgi:hypothetical protein
VEGFLVPILILPVERRGQGKYMMSPCSNMFVHWVIVCQLIEIFLFNLVQFWFVQMVGCFSLVVTSCLKTSVVHISTAKSVNYRSQAASPN